MIGAVLECCAGIDVGKKFVVVCLMTGPADGEAHDQTRKYATTNGDLEKLRDWLRSCGCFHVVMESTGAYWKPIFNILEEVAGMQVVLANSQQVKNLRGHKTDPNDSRWLAHLLRHGMIRPSYIPPRTIRELRGFTRRDGPTTRRWERLKAMPPLRSSANGSGWPRRSRPRAT